MKVKVGVSVLNDTKGPSRTAQTRLEVLENEAEGGRGQLATEGEFKRREGEKKIQIARLEE